MATHFASRLALPTLLLVSACAPQGSYPSLEPRPVEKLGFDEPVREAPRIASDTALRAQTATHLQQARGGQDDFQKELPAAQRAVAAARGSGSESWVVAQQAVSRLEAARRRTASALAELDALATSRAERPTSAGDLEALNAAIAAAAQLSQDQQRVIDGLKARLSPA